MSYFSKFPFIKDYHIGNQKYTGIDITRRTGILSSMKDNPNAYQEYMVQEGESANMIADRVYDNANWYFVILMFNDIFDELEDWPLDQLSLDTYITRKYSDPYAIHHWKAISTGAWVCLLHPEYDRIPVTNYEYEIEVNESKRKIKVPLGRYAAQIVAEHQKAIAL